MAVWQFKFYLVPIKGIERVHGHIMPVLEEYRASTPEKLLSLPLEPDQLPTYPNYWEGIQKGDETLQAIQTLLPQCESWSEKAIMFCNGDNRVEVWNDDISCFLDIKNFSSSLLVGL